MYQTGLHFPSGFFTNSLLKSKVVLCTWQIFQMSFPKYLVIFRYGYYNDF